MKRSGQFTNLNLQAIEQDSENEATDSENEAMEQNSKNEATEQYSDEDDLGLDLDNININDGFNPISPNVEPDRGNINTDSMIESNIETVNADGIPDSSIQTVSSSSPRKRTREGDYKNDVVTPVNKNSNSNGRT